MASAFIDNIPFAATMIPVIRSLAEAQGIPLGTLAWALSMGTDIGGNATPIGASANVVGTSIASQERPPHRLGPLLQGDGPADADCDGHRAADHQAALFWLTQRRNFVIDTGKQGVKGADEA